MPELPEVETVRGGLAVALEGRRIEQVTVRRRDLRRPLPRGFAGRLEARTVLKIARRSKYLIWHLDDGTALLGHLGMSGSFKVLSARAAPPLAPHDHVVFLTDHGAEIRFHDPRRFGLMDLCREADLAAHPLLANLGPEPLDPAFDGPTLAAALAGRRGPIKAALLDQRLVSGIGNIYACEALYRAGLSPRRSSGGIRGRRAERLVEAIKGVLQEAIVAGGASLRDHRRPDGEIGYFQYSFAVYGREGHACARCGNLPGPGVKRIVQSGRSTFYCPRHQR